MTYKYLTALTAFILMIMSGCGGSGGSNVAGASASLTSPPICPNGTIKTPTNQSPSNLLCDAPKLLSISPANNASDVSVETFAGVVVTTDSPLDINSITTDNIKLSISNSTVPGVVTNVGVNGFKFTPNNKLNYAQQYTFTASVRDILGKPLTTTMNFCTIVPSPNSAGTLCVVNTFRESGGDNTVTRTFIDGSTEKVFYSADRGVTVFTSAKGSITTTVVNAIEVVQKPIGTTSAYTIDYRFPNGTRTQLTSLDVSNTSIYQLTTNLDAVKDYGAYKVAVPSNTFKPESLCEYPKTNIIFPQSYMGQFPLPDIKAKPLRNGIIKAVGMSDSWGQMNSGCGGRSEFEDLDETFARLKSMGVQYAVYGPTVYYSRTDEGWRIFPETETGNSGSFATRDDFKKMIQIAGKYGIKLEWFPQMLRWDPTSKTQLWTFPAKTAPELRGFLDAYEIYLVDLAKFLNSSNAGGIQLGGNIVGLDLTLSMDADRQTEYINFLKRTLPKIRNIFAGEIVLQPPGQAEIFAQIPEIATNINGFIIGTSASISAAGSTQYTITDVKNNLNANILPNLLFQNKYNVPIYFNFGTGSRNDGITFYDTGFCLINKTSTQISTDGTCIQRQVVPDFSFQAVFIEGVFEWLNENQQINIGRIQVDGYQHIDQLIPTNWFPSLDWSIRDKPAELIVKSWYLSKN